MILVTQDFMTLDWVFNFEWYPEEAEKGKVVFFPGWLEHEMLYDEDEYRITMLIQHGNRRVK